MAVRTQERRPAAARVPAVQTIPVPLPMRIFAGASFIGLAFAYLLAGGTWWAGLALLLAPDLSMLAFLLGPRGGVGVYNAVHRPLLPTVLLMVAWLAHFHVASLVLMVWVAHIAMDRAANYGLKATRA